MDRTALIVGAGIGGLAAAVGLRRVGWHVLVLEQAGTVQSAGSGISLWPNAIRALDELGVAEPLRGSAARPGALGVRTKTGRWLLGPTDMASAARYGVDIRVLHRADLHDLLRAALPPTAVIYGAQVTGLSEGGRKVFYRVDDTDVDVMGDLVVGADGINSTLRALCWPTHPGPSYAGYTSWRGIAAPRSPLPPTWGLSFGAGETFGRLPLVDGRTYWFATANAPPGQRFAKDKIEVSRRFNDWHPPVPELIAATEPTEVLHHDIDDLAHPLPAYTYDRLVLLGDAAHAMTPDLGQGGCQAIEDAVVLAAALADTPDIATGLRRYEAQRLPRTRKLIRRSRRTGRFNQTEHGVAVTARAVLSRLTPPRMAYRAMTSAAAWTPPTLIDPTT